MTGVIETEGLTKRYGKRQGLDGLDLEVRQGEVFGFLGPNGAGKTTTIRLLLDLIRPTSGTARVLGTAPRAGGPVLRRRIGYLAGDFVVDGGQSSRELLAFLAHLRGGVPAARSRCPRGAARARPPDPHPQPVQGQPSEGRDRPGVHAPARAADPRRALVGPRPARPADVPRPCCRGQGRRADRVHVQSRAVRGRAVCRPGRHRARWADGRRRGLRDAPRPRGSPDRDPVRRPPSRRPHSRACRA